MKQFFASLCTLQFLLFVAVLGLALMVPIYTDEIAWKIIEARYFLDGHKMIYVFPQCKGAFATAPLWWSVPVYWVQAWLFSDLSNLFKLRALGWLAFVAWIPFVWRLATRLPELRGIASWKLLAFILAYLGIGVLPFAMSLSRPEQPILWGLTLLGLLPLVVARDRFPRWTVLGHLAIWVVLFSIHPKTALFTPLLVASLFSTVRPWKVRIAGLLALGLIIVQTQQFWSARTACPEVPFVQSELDRHMLKPRGLLANPAGFVRQGLSNLSDVSTLIYHVDFNYDYNQHWLPSQESGRNVTQVLIKYLLRAFSLLFLLYMIRSGVHLYRDRRSEGVPVKAGLMAGLGCSLLLWTSLQSVKNFYEIALFFPAFGLFLLMGFRKDDLRKAPRAAFALGLVFLVFGLMSQANLLWQFMPEARGSWSQGGYLPKQPVSYSAFHGDEIRAKVLQSANLCGLPGKDPKHMVLDEITYTVFGNTFQPFFHLNFDWGAGLFDLPQLLRSYPSDGLITRCSVLEPELKSRATQNGEFCCIGPFR